MAPQVVPSSRAAAARSDLDGLVADAPRRHVDDPLEADAVGVRAQDAQVGQRVLDLAPGVEPRAADELVADAVAQERFLDRAGLGVHPVHDRDLAGPEARVVLVVGAPGQGASRVRRPGPRPGGRSTRPPPPRCRPRSAGSGRRPAFSVQSFLSLRARVARDDRVGGVEDQLRRAVVLLELDHRGVRPVALEVEDVAQVRAAPRVDRLVVVADDAQVAVAWPRAP